MKAVIGFAVVFMLGTTARGADQAQRTKLQGLWQVEGGDEGGTWSFEEKGDGMHIVHAEGGHTVADFECTTLGKDCTVKESGRKAKVSMWYSGDKLVELVTKGSDVVKRRFSVTPEGDALVVEEIPVVPAGKPETLHFKRSPLSSRAQD